MAGLNLQTLQSCIHSVMDGMDGDGRLGVHGIGPSVTGPILALERVHGSTERGALSFHARVCHEVALKIYAFMAASSQTEPCTEHPL